VARERGVYALHSERRRRAVGLPRPQEQGDVPLAVAKGQAPSAADTEGDLGLSFGLSIAPPARFAPAMAGKGRR
jgi:hypothetical protein